MSMRNAQSRMSRLLCRQRRFRRRAVARAPHNSAVLATRRKLSARPQLSSHTSRIQHPPNRLPSPVAKLNDVRLRHDAACLTAGATVETKTPQSRGPKMRLGDVTSDPRRLQAGVTSAQTRHGAKRERRMAGDSLSEDGGLRLDPAGHRRCWVVGVGSDGGAACADHTAGERRRRVR